jgi:hypothetical protein
MNLVIDDRPVVAFGSNEADALRSWAKLAEGQQLQHFAEFGWSQDVPALSEQLEAALDKLKPERSIEESAVRLLDALDNNEGCEVVAFASAPGVAVPAPFRRWP